MLPFFLFADIAAVCPKQKPYFGTNVTVDFRLDDYCEDNPSIREKIKSLSAVPKDFILQFKEVGIDSTASFFPYLGVFLNTLQVRFTNLEGFQVSCEADGEELSFDLGRLGGEVKPFVPFPTRFRGFNPHFPFFRFSSL